MRSEGYSSRSVCLCVYVSVCLCVYDYSRTTGYGWVGVVVSSISDDKFLLKPRVKIYIPGLTFPSYNNYYYEVHNIIMH